MLGVWAGSALSIAATVIAARALGPVEYGSVFLAIAVVTSIATFLDVSFEEATVFYGNRSLAARDLPGLRALLTLSLRIDVGIGVVVTAIIAAAAAPIAEVASGGQLDATLVRIVALSVLVTTADSTAYAVLSLARRSDLRARAVAVTSAFRLLGVAIAVVVGGAEAVAISYVLGGAAGSVVLGRLAWREGWRRWDAGPRAGARPVGGWELVRFGFHTSVTSSVQAISGTLVPVLLARAAGPGAVGLFRVALLPMLVSQTVSGPVRLAMFPEQARLVAEGRTGEIRKAAKAYTLIAFGLGVTGAAVAWVAMPWLIPFLYSSDFEASVTPARILLIAAVFQVAFGWRKSMLAAIGRPQIRTRLAMLNLIVVVPLLVAIADRGAEGAAIAVTAGTVATGLAWLIIAPRVLSEEALLAARRERSKPGRRKGGRTPPTPEQDPSAAGR